MNTLTRICVVFVLTATLGACNAIPLHTAGAPTEACDEGLATGILTNNRPDGLALRTPTGDVLRVLWPFGYNSRGFVGSMELVDQTGRAIAGEGDFVEMSGGANAEGIFVACADTIRKVVPQG